MNLSLDVLDGVGWLDFEGDRLSGEGFDENLHTTSESKHKMESGFLLDVVIRKSPAVLQLLSSEDESLLIRRDTFLILDLGLHVFNSVRWLNLKGDGLASESLNEDLHTSTKSEDQVKS